MTNPQGPFGPNPYGGNPFGGAPFGGVPPGPPVYTAPPPHRPRANTLATLSVVFAFLFAPAGALLGHLGLAQIRRSGERGRDRAIVGLMLSYAVITLTVVALIAWATQANSNPIRTAAPGTTANPNSTGSSTFFWSSPSAPASRPAAAPPAGSRLRPTPG